MWRLLVRVVFGLILIFVSALIGYTIAMNGYLKNYPLLEKTVNFLEGQIQFNLLNNTRQVQPVSTAPEEKQSVATPIVPSPKRFTLKETGFSFSYPFGWQLYSDGAAHIYLSPEPLIAGPDNTAPSAAVVIEITPANLLASSADNFITAEKEKFMNPKEEVLTIPGGQEVIRWSPQEATKENPGYREYLLTYQFNFLEIPLNFIALWKVNEREGSQYLEEIEQMVKSIRIGE